MSGLLDELSELLHGLLDWVESFAKVPYAGWALAAISFADPSFPGSARPIAHPLTIAFVILLAGGFWLMGRAAKRAGSKETDAANGGGL